MMFRRMYRIHIPYRKRKRDRQPGLVTTGGFFFLGYGFVQLLCKVVRLLIMMLENQDAVLTILLLNTTKDEHPPPPAVFLYLSSSINVVRSIQKDAEVFLSRVDAHFVAHAVQRSAVFRKNLIGILFIAFCGPTIIKD